MALMRSRRGIVCFGVLLVSPMLSAAVLAKPEDIQPGASLAGQLLVATPEMSDPRFQHTVILMVQHNKDGALGIVINRPREELPIAQLLDALGLDSKGNDGTVRLYAGGPVQPEIGLVVHSAEYHRTGTVNIDGRVAFVEGDAKEIMPGITCYTGGKHTYASQYVGVKTAKGIVILASDSVYLHENLEKHLPISQSLDQESNLRAQDRMRKLAAEERLIVPGHDPAQFTRFHGPAPTVVRIE